MDFHDGDRVVPSSLALDRRVLRADDVGVVIAWRVDCISSRRGLIRVWRHGIKAAEIYSPDYWRIDERKTP